MQGATGAQAASSATTRSLTDLDKLKNLKVTVDFRQVYASLIEQWLGADAGAVIPRAGELARVGLIK